MTISQAFQLALQHHQAGRLAEAEALCRQILAVQPNHPDPLHLRGLIAHQVGRHDLAVEWIRRAIALNPRNSAAYCNLGEACRATGRMDDAIEAYRHALDLEPNFPEALNNLGIALTKQGQLEEAIAAFRHALELRPGNPEALNNLGIALKERGRLDEAIAAFRRALELKPDYAEAHNNLGIALRERGQLDEAVAACRQALELKPGYPVALNNLGIALAEQGALDEAVAAYRRALEFRADYAEAHGNLGAALRKRGQIDEAVAECRRALELKPDCPATLNNLGIALAERGQIDEALASIRRALERTPGDAGTHSNLIFTLHFHPGYCDKSISGEFQRWNGLFGEPLRQFVRPHANDLNPDRRLRVGYVSPDFRDHPVGRYVLPLFERRDRDRVEILCYSGVTRSDSITERLRAMAGEWRNTVGVSDAILAEMIREDRVDILVDLTMHSAGNRLLVFARQPAPVQVAWLAYAGSTGLRGMGYRLTDAHLDPPGEKPAWSAEEPVRLPDCWCCYDPAGESPEINELPALSAEGVTLGSLNTFAKVNERVLDLWARVMEAVKGSRLLILCPEGWARERVRERFAARGIGAERIEFAGIQPRLDYLRLYQRIDIALDPFPCNGMTTACDALWMGVPVLTLPGALPISRAGLSLLSSVGLRELAASSEEDYVRIAAELAGNLPRLANLRAALRPRMQASPLMDAPRFARNVEAAYRSMWERWRRAHCVS